MSRESGAGRKWAYLGVILGGVASLAANIARTFVPPDGALPAWSPPAGVVVAAVFWPLALFIAVEIFARVAWSSTWQWQMLRYLGVLPVGLVAAVVSYRHMSELLLHYGETQLTAYAGPLAVDGLMAMSTAALVATAPQKQKPVSTPLTEAAAISSAPRASGAVMQYATPAGPSLPVAQPAFSGSHVVKPQRSTPATPTPSAGTKPKKTTRKLSTKERIERLRAKNPELTHDQIAKKLKISDRTVRRYVNSAPAADSAPVHASEAAVQAAVLQEVAA